MLQNSIPRHQLSKSTFMYGVQCTKRVWLHKNLIKERDVQTASQARIFQQGTDVGLLAQQLFPGGINAEPENYYSYQKSVADTARYIRNGHEIIYEAAFQFEGIMCAVDIMVKTNNKWYAYEVKSTNSVKKEHILDAALQYYVISNTGIDLADFNIIHFNKNYIRQGDLEINKLFHPVSVLNEVTELQPFISSMSGVLLEVLTKKTPPEIEVGDQCNNPYPCDFQMFCNRGALPSVLNQKEAMDMNQLSAFANNLKFPLSFLSLQTWSTAVPQFDGHWPYKQVCFQYSLHKQRTPGAALEQFYFLEEKINNRQKELIESLLKAAGEEGSILVHEGSFVKYHLQELKKQFLPLENLINSVQCRIVELLSPFRKDVLLEIETENDMMQEESVHGFSIMESSSAAAAFYNLRDEENKTRLIEIREALFFYGYRSSFDLALKIQRWRSS